MKNESLIFINHFRMLALCTDEAEKDGMHYGHFRDPFQLGHTHYAVLCISHNMKLLKFPLVCCFSANRCEVWRLLGWLDVINRGQYFTLQGSIHCGYIITYYNTITKAFTLTLTPWNDCKHIGECYNHCWIVIFGVVNMPSMSCVFLSCETRIAYDKPILGLYYC